MTLHAIPHDVLPVLTMMCLQVAGLLGFSHNRNVPADARKAFEFAAWYGVLVLAVATAWSVLA